MRVLGVGPLWLGIVTDEQTHNSPTPYEELPNGARIYDEMTPEEMAEMETILEESRRLIALIPLGPSLRTVHPQPTPVVPRTRSY